MAMFQLACSHCGSSRLGLLPSLSLFFPSVPLFSLMHLDTVVRSNGSEMLHQINAGRLLPSLVIYLVIGDGAEDAL